MSAPRPADAGVRLDEDSADLTDEDIASSVEVKGAEAEAELLSGVRCTEVACTLPMVLTALALKRRKPSLYERVQLRCDAGHGRTIHLHLLDPIG